MLRDERRRQSLLYQLAARVTVSETHFFRHPDQLEAVIKHLLELDARRPRDARLSLWSAGCASGEEPYSLGDLARSRPRRAPHATLPYPRNDVSRDALSRAREAAYTAWSFRALRPGSSSTSSAPLTAACAWATAGSGARSSSSSRAASNVLAASPISRSTRSSFRNVAGLPRARRDRRDLPRVRPRARAGRRPRDRSVGSTPRRRALRTHRGDVRLLASGPGETCSPRRAPHGEGGPSRAPGHAPGTPALRVERQRPHRSRRRYRHELPPLRRRRDCSRSETRAAPRTPSSSPARWWLPSPRRRSLCASSASSRSRRAIPPPREALRQSPASIHAPRCLATSSRWS